MKTTNALVGSAVLAIISTASAGAATLVTGSDITLGVSGALSRLEPQFGGPIEIFFDLRLPAPVLKPAPSQSATVTVGDDGFAALFLDTTLPETLFCSVVCMGVPSPAEDYRITASVAGLTFTALDSHVTFSGEGATVGELSEVLLVTGLEFQDGHTLSGVVIEGVGDGVSLPTLIGVTDSGVFLDLASLGINAPNTAFTVSFVTQASLHVRPQVVPLPATAPLVLAGLAALRLARRRRNA